MPPPKTARMVSPDIAGKAVAAVSVIDSMNQGGYLESAEEIPEPHAFTAHVRIGQQDYPVVFEEHEHTREVAGPDNNMRAALIHVVADAAVSVLVIVGLMLARLHDWMWMDPLAGIVGAAVIRELGLRPDPGHWRDPARYEPRPAYGKQSAPSGRERGRTTRRSPPLALGAGASGRNYFDHYDASARG
jgi:hypothetical protein